MQESGLEVFQDLNLTGPADRRHALKAALADAATGPWAHAAGREREFAQATGTDEVAVFTRSETDGVDAVGLVLWGEATGYRVTNIIPLQVKELGQHRYNLALRDFVNQVARIAVEKVGFMLSLSPDRQGLDDWLPPAAAHALRRFSGAANKATGSSHPADRRRWQEFLIAAYGDSGSLDVERLERWLVEVEGWTADVAWRLAAEYEFGQDLLRRFDSQGG